MGEQSEGKATAGQSTNKFWALSMRLVEEAFVTARWLMATLVTINSGVAFGIIGASAIPISAKTIAGQWFCLGIVTAIFFGVFQMNGAKVAGIFLMKDLSKAKSKVMPWLAAAWVMGLASLGCFVVGALEVGLNLK